MAKFVTINFRMHTYTYIHKHIYILFMNLLPHLGKVGLSYIHAQQTIGVPSSLPTCPREGSQPRGHNLVCEERTHEGQHLGSPENTGNERLLLY